MLKVVTYNILFAQNPDKIIQNITALAKQGVQIFCLQEVVRIEQQPFIVESLLRQLGSDWKAIYNVDVGNAYLHHGTCILWNNSQFRLLSEEKYFLPKLKALAIHESLFTMLAGHRPAVMTRRSIAGIFSYHNKTIKIVNLHLDHVGGPKHRQKQLEYLLNQTAKSDEGFAIYCGDFNSIDLLMTGREKNNFRKCFGPDFTEATDRIPWTADLNYAEAPGKQTLLLKCIKAFHIHVRKKLDYIWVKNMEVINSKTITVQGSDHLPVFATLKL